jgi:hypothetical protein
MGSSHWSDDHYNTRASLRAATNTPVFQYSAQIDSGQISAGCHKDLNPKNIVRESRDSAAHPESNAIMVWMDETGSMGQIPVLLQQKLPKLLGLLLRRGYLTDPQICFGAIGDVRSDRAPLQVGNFESGNEMDDDMSKIYLEGNGGGNNGESYELAMYFALHKTSIDCLEKRGKKGYMFIIGDEPLRTEVRREDVLSVIGDHIESTTTENLVDALKDKYETFILIPGAQKHRDDPIRQSWTRFFGERVVNVENMDEIAEAIAGLIGLNEGFDTNAVVSDTKASSSLSKELATYGAKSGRALKVNVSGGLTVSSVEGI